jgi:hypothetical protein
MNEGVYKNFSRKDFRHDREMPALQGHSSLSPPAMPSKQQSPDEVYRRTKMLRI